MTPYEIYTFVLCFIVFAALTALFSVFIVYTVKMMLKLIRGGLEDESIKTEYLEMQKNPPRSDLIIRIFSGVICAAFFLLFAVSVTFNLTEKTFMSDMPTLKVVKSPSMSEKFSKNLYLYREGLDDQIGMFDLIVTHKLPAEDELELYDIVVYESKGDLIVHRIIGIEEPNDKHPNERRFLLRGDANEVSDIYPVLYSQMKAIYRGERIPFLGSFIAFLQSPAGWICMILALFGMIAAPLADKKLQAAKNERLIAMGLIVVEEPEPIVEEPEIFELDEIVAEVIEENHIPRFSRKEDTRIFQERLYRSSKELKHRYAMIDSYLFSNEKISVNYSRKYQTFRMGQFSIAKLTVKENSILVYLNLDPEKYKNTKYVFTDVSHTNSFSSFPLLVRVNKDDQVEDVHDLINDVISSRNTLKKG